MAFKFLFFVLFEIGFAFTIIKHLLPTKNNFVVEGFNFNFNILVLIGFEIIINT